MTSNNFLELNEFRQRISQKLSAWENQCGENRERSLRIVDCIEKSDFSHDGEFMMDGLFDYVDVVLALWVSVEFLNCFKSEDWPHYNKLLSEVCFFSKSDPMMKAFHSQSFGLALDAYDYCRKTATQVFPSENEWDVDAKMPGFADSGDSALLLLALNLNWHNRMLHEPKIV